MATDVIPPKYVITADDKRGLLVVTVGIVLSFVLTCFLIRLWLRIRSREWKLDDWFLGGATVLHTAQSGIIFYLVDLGLGASQEGVPLSQLEKLGRGAYAAQIFYICTLFISKCSVLFLYLRLSPGGTHRVASWGVVGLSCLWAVISVILIVVPCNPVQAYDEPEKCTNRWAKWQAIGAIDIVTELLIFLIAIQLVWSLQMRFKTKVFAVLAFSARLPVVAAAGVRLYYIHKRLTGQSYTFEYIVATEWQMGYAIMSSTITGLGPFLRPFTTEFKTSYKTSGYGYSSQRSNQLSGSNTGPPLRHRPSDMSQNYLMETLPSRRGSKSGSPDLEGTGDATRPPGSHASNASTSTIPASPPAPITLTADEHFQPAERFRRHDAEVWVGDRTASIARDEALGVVGSESRLAIGKRTEFRVESNSANSVQ